MSIFQSLRRTLTISLYTFLLFLPSPFHDVTRPRVLLLLLQWVSNACVGQRSAGYSRGRKRDIFYSRTLTWKGTFIFADRPWTAGVAVIFLPSSKLSHGNINATFVSAVHGPGVRGDLQYGYRSYLQGISSVSPFHSSSLQLIVSSILRVSPLIVLRFSKLHSTGLESSRLTANSCSSVSSSSPVTPLFPAFYLRRGERSRDDFQFQEHLFFCNKQQVSTPSNIKSQHRNNGFPT